MLNSCKNSVKILKIACIQVGTVANEGITKNALLDQKTDVFFCTGCTADEKGIFVGVEEEYLLLLFLGYVMFSGHDVHGQPVAKHYC